MKAILLPLICLLTALAVLQAQDDPPPDFNTYMEYIIMVPPWRVCEKIIIKGTAVKNEFQISPKDAMDQMKTWAGKQGRLFETGDITYLERGHIHRPTSGTLIFNVELTEAQAMKFENEFKYHSKEPEPDIAFYVRPQQEIYPDPIVDIRDPKSEKEDDTKLSTKSIVPADWAREIVVKDAFGGMPADGVAPIPVLYVVDTGVQLWVKSADASKPWPAHPEFSAAMSSNRLHLRQGRVAYGGGGYHWPPTPAEAMTYNKPDPAELWTKSSNPPPYDEDIKPDGLPAEMIPAPTAPPYCLDPNLDPIGHGTKITSTALGANVGVLSQFTNAAGKTPRVDVESIRIYNTSSAYTQDAIDGIGMALEAHLIRDSNGLAPSVLLFASRTASGFDDLLEVQLWWAWYQGMVCVVSAGNQTTTYTTGKYPPDSQWFPHTGPMPTSPSRFAPPAPGYEGSWPIWPNPPAGNPYPTGPYLIMVGGTNATKTAIYNAGWGSTSSRGPDIDVLAPATLVPCANVVTPLPTTGTPDGLVNATGTSLSAGFAAGAALAHLCYYPTTASTPSDVRQWVVPDIGPVKASMINTTTGTVSPVRPSDCPLPTSYYPRVPKLKLVPLPLPILVKHK